MARNKSLARKIRLGKARDKASNVPTFVIMKTRGKVRWTPYSRRHWRSTRLKR